MININLLPWRELRREMRRKQYFVQLGLIAFLAVLLIILANSIIGQQISSQAERNEILTVEIQQMNLANAKINNANNERDQLIIQVKKLQQLHNSRFQLVSLFNGLVHILPEGVHLTGIKRTRDKITLHGIATNHDDVTILLRDIHNSKWFTDPELSEVTDSTTNDNKVFRLTMLQQNYGEKK